MSDIAYAVHTATCTYLLDEDGICRWAQGRLGGVAPPGADRCVGAQFLACLDLRAEGGLVGDMRPGGSALFVRSEGARMVMLRTLPIERVDIRTAPEDPPTDPIPSFPFNPEETEVLPAPDPEEVLDLEDLLSISVTEITVSLPLYRSPPQAPQLPQAPWPGSVAPPGRRPR
jgi:hypothetical protein